MAVNAKIVEAIYEQLRNYLIERRQPSNNLTILGTIYNSIINNRIVSICVRVVVDCEVLQLQVRTCWIG
jgi:hypothetical protein